VCISILENRSLVQLLEPLPCFPHLFYKQLEGLNVEYRQIMTSVQADLLFEMLEKELVYLRGSFARVCIFGRSVPIPRQHVAYGDGDLFYSFSGLALPTKPWTPTLLAIKCLINKVTCNEYNYVLINKYEDGNDCIGFHADDERELDPRVPIATLSLGQERPFVFKAIKPPHQCLTISLASGSLLTMKHPTNNNYKHSLPRRKNITKSRISLTFRRILPRRPDMQGRQPETK